MYFKNKGRVLRWRLILEDYDLGVDYIQGKKNIVTNALSIFPINGNQETTQESTYKRENVSEINDIK